MNPSPRVTDTTNLYVFSVCFLALFTSYLAIQNLETSLSSVNCQHCHAGTSGVCQNIQTQECTARVSDTCDFACPATYTECKTSIGAFSLGALYMSCMFTCLFAAIFPQLWGEKVCMIWSIYGFSLFMLANLVLSIWPGNPVAQWLGLFPSAILAGFSTSILWTCQGSYLTQISATYALDQGISSREALGSFNGVFWGIYQISQISGNFSASFLLLTLHWQSSSLFTLYFILAIVAACLMSRIQDVNVEYKIMDEPSSNELQKLLITSRHPRGRHVWRRMISLSKALFYFAHDEKMATLMPLCFFSGLEQAFAYGQFTSKFVKLSLGQKSIGYIMVLYGLIEVVGSIGAGKLSSVIGAKRLFQFAALVLLAVYSFLALLPVSFCDEQWLVLSCCALGLGLGNAIFATVLPIVIGERFPDNLVLGYAAGKFYNTAAVSLAFLYSPYFSIPLQIGILLTALVIGIITFSYSAPSGPLTTRERTNDDSMVK